MNISTYSSSNYYCFFFFLAVREADRVMEESKVGFFKRLKKNVPRKSATFFVGKYRNVDIRNQML